MLLLVSLFLNTSGANWKEAFWANLAHQRNQNLCEPDARRIRFRNKIFLTDNKLKKYTPFIFNISK